MTSTMSLRLLMLTLLVGTVISQSDEFPEKSSNLEPRLIILKQDRLDDDSTNLNEGPQHAFPEDVVYSQQDSQYPRPDEDGQSSGEDGNVHHQLSKDVQNGKPVAMANHRGSDVTKRFSEFVGKRGVLALTPNFSYNMDNHGEYKTPHDESGWDVLIPNQGDAHSERTPSTLIPLTAIPFQRLRQLPDNKKQAVSKFVNKFYRMLVSDATPKRQYDLVGKRAFDFVGKRPFDFVGKRPLSLDQSLSTKRQYDLIGKRYDFIGKRNLADLLSKRYDFIGKKNDDEFQSKRYDFIGKKNTGDFQSKRYDFIGKKNTGDFQSKRYDFIGKRGPAEFQAKRYDFIGKRLPTDLQSKRYDFIGKKSSDNFQSKRYDFIGKKNSGDLQSKRYDFIGKRSPSDSQSKRYDFIGKRSIDDSLPKRYDFIGKRSMDDSPTKRYDFIGKRSEDNSLPKRYDFIGKRGYDFLGRRSFDDDYEKRSYDYLGKRSQQMDKRYSEWLGKRKRTMEMPGPALMSDQARLAALLRDNRLRKRLSRMLLQSRMSVSNTPAIIGRKR